MKSKFRYFLVLMFSFIAFSGIAYSADAGENIITKVNFKKVDVNSVEDVYKEREGLFVFSHVNIDLRKLSAEKRKDVFVRLLLPSINVVQKEVLNNREIVKKLRAKENLNDEEKAYATKLFTMYKTKEGNWDELQHKMIIYPTSLILTQGAIESAWGTSRFFREANNAFGIWASGNNPNEKTINAKGSRGDFTPKLRVYDTLRETVLDITLIVSRSSAYKNLRNMVWEEKSPYDIAGGLLRYSEEGAEYVKKVRSTLKYNHFEKYDEEIPYY